MNFIIYDISLLVIFVILISIFLYRGRKNLKREGLLLLYKASWGIKLIDKIGKKYKKTLNVLSYVAVVLGYILMAGIIYMFGRILWIYILNPEIVRAIKIPPITPLFPYLPQAFHLDFLPPLYFIYFIIIIAVIAIPHEFFHGIFSAHNKIKIKKTGFGFFPFFLPVFLAAFVEPDEKQMQKKKIFPQMSVLAAGTFANILTAILFFLIMIGFFALAFIPSGVNFDSYTYAVAGISAITSVNGAVLENASHDAIANLLNEGLNEIYVGEEKFLLTQDFLDAQSNINDYVLLYEDAPAINAGLEGAIIEINGVKISNRDELGEEILKNSPGDAITITTLIDDEERDYEIVLGNYPGEEDVAYLGIGFSNSEGSGLLGKIIVKLSSFKDSHTYYAPKFSAALFIYNLLWWLVLASFSVALVNMLPVGIFDGGKFFYLTVLAITKKEKIAKRAFSFITYLFLLLLAVIMIFWFIGMF